MSICWVQEITVSDELEAAKSRKSTEVPDSVHFGDSPQTRGKGPLRADGLARESFITLAAGSSEF